MVAANLTQAYKQNEGQVSGFSGRIDRLAAPIPNENEIVAISDANVLLPHVAGQFVKL